MAEQMHIGLDNPVFRGRLRQPASSRPQHTVSAPRRNYLINDYAVPVQKTQSSRPVPDAVPVSDFTASAIEAILSVKKKRTGYSKGQWAMFGLAALVLSVGLAVSFQGFQTNKHAAAQVSALSKAAANSEAAVPTNVKPGSESVGAYTVAPDLPRYLKIPKLGVMARVRQVGLTGSGALDTPSNVYDAAWYSGSAKPGQSGASVIDGHVSSWNTKGVFYGLKKLQPGDSIQVVRGDGAVLNYQVVRTQVYGSDNVDMKAAMMPVNASRPGLNLITCTGQVIKGTSQFNQRLIVYTEQVSP
jgi:sortase (surface protein transpeptidase)